MAQLNLQFYNDENEYSDGPIEETILQELKNELDEFSVLSHNDDWVHLYHLSPFRQNILNWYPFDPNASLLEVGAGCGALTSLFCEKVKNVTAVELTKKRSLINFERNKKSENLEIIVGNFHNIKFNENYDYIILNGVLEYAAHFSEGINPYASFLNTLKKLLKKDGKILISIENKLGLKYFNAAPEDHDNRLFAGLNNYSLNSNAYTFTKVELKQLLDQCGFNHVKFFYPAPDYKFPREIYTDQNISEAIYAFHDNLFQVNRLSLFQEDKVRRMISNEQIADIFANSFLVEVSPDELAFENRIEYVKLPMNRNKEFCLKTQIYSDKDIKYVFKEAMFPEAQPFLEKMLQTAKKSTQICGYKYVAAEKKEKKVFFEYIKGTSVLEDLKTELRKQNKNYVNHFIVEFAERVRENAVLATYNTEEFEQIFGKSSEGKELCKKFFDCDLIFANLYQTNDGGKIIDYEWIFPFYIPVDYVLWRALRLFYYENEIVSSNYSLDELFNLINLNRDLLSCYESYELHFNDLYVRNQTLLNYEGTIYNVESDLDYLYQAYNPVSKIYIDYGEGFSEEKILTAKVHMSGNKFEVHFNLSALLDNNKRIKKMRWDPCDQPVLLKELEISADKKNYDLELVANNGYMVEKNIFYSPQFDPSLLILGDYDGVSKISIKGSYHVEQREMLPYLEQILLQANQDKQKLITKNEELEKDLTQQIEHLKNIENKLSYKVYRKAVKAGKRAKKIILK